MWVTGWRAPPPPRGGQSDIWPRWGVLWPVLSRVRNTRGRRRGGPRGGHGSHRLAGRAGVREGAGLGLRALRRPRRDRRVRRERAVEAGGLGRPRRLPGPPSTPPRPPPSGAREAERRVCASDPSELSSRQASLLARGNPDKGGAPGANPRAAAPCR